jgi:RimJ/RimL family protein N-acetyltransferase
MEWRIRKARTEDAVGIIELIEGVLSEEGICLPIYSDEFVPAIEDQRKAIEDIAGSNCDLFLVAEANGKIVGILNTKSNKRKAYLHDISFGMSVSKEVRGAGIGKALLATFLEWAKTKPELKAINLSVWKRNKAAIKLYEGFGFEAWGTRKYSTFKEGSFQEEVYMELLLGDC